MTEDVADVEPVTRRTHDSSWSANLEKPYHAADRDLVVEQAKDAIEATEPGYHVNLVTTAATATPRRASGTRSRRPSTAFDSSTSTGVAAAGTRLALTWAPSTRQRTGPVE